MWRERLIEIKKEKGISTKMISEMSGVSIETVNRIFKSNNIKTEAPRIDTIIDVCKALEVEVWEIFYIGDKSFVSLTAEIAALRVERDVLLAENAVQKNKIDTLKDKVETLKDDMLAVHNYYIKQKLNN